MSAKISSSFWGDNGHPAVEAFVKKGAKSIDALSTYMSERAKIEEDYAKSLQKLLKKTDGVADTGSVDKLWQRARQEMENEVNLRTAFYQELKTNATSIAGTEKDVRKTSKTQLDAASKVHKEFQHMTQTITKAQQKYNKSCQDNAKIDQEVAAAQSNPKNLAKAQDKQKAGQKEQAKFEQEYQSAVQKLVQFQPQWEEKVRSAYDSLQEMEVQRLETIKSGFDKFQQALKGLSGYIEKASNSLSDLVSSANPKSDLAEWISSNKTGTSPPAPPTFVPFGASSPSGSSSGSSASKSVPTPPRTETRVPPPSTSSGSSKTSSGPPKSVPASTPPPAPAAAAEEEYAQEEYSEEYAEEYGEEYAEEEYAEEYAEEGTGEVKTAAWDYTAQEENEISFKAGEKITVVSKDDAGWWTGTNEAGETGMFPANYLQE